MVPKLRLPRWFVQFRAVALKEIRHTVRDRRMMAMLIVAPVLQLGVFGAAVDFDVDRVPTIVVDHDRSSESRDFLAGLFADGTLKWTRAADSEDEARASVDSNEASVAIVVSRGFAEELGRGGIGHLQVMVDGTDPNRGAIALAAASRYAQRQSVERATSAILARKTRLGEASTFGAIAIDPSIRRVGQVAFMPRVFHNPRLRSAIYMVPGIIALLLLMITVIITAMGLARERETGTLEQVMVTPISPIVLLTGKLAPYVFIGLFDFLLALVVASRVFDVPIRGNVAVALLGTMAYLVSTLGVGLLISTVSRTQQQAFIGGFLFMLPAILLSSVMTPLWGIPAWLMPLVRVNPAKYYVEIVRGVLLRGSTFYDLRQNLAILGIIGAVVLSFAAFRFKRTLG
jgi:ABC-2 type transport system permease protein